MCSPLPPFFDKASLPFKAQLKLTFISLDHRPEGMLGAVVVCIGEGGVVVCAVRLTPEGRYQAVLFISFKASSTVPG